ncbi:DUF6134 family protein [Gaetbulibacter aestuarii]|uniref:DUF6134 family protein n=1 Tax=Gaetbulibacter aestuarii TaxID=1502358 RepID=A0ABW7MY09_9FLAO
MKKNSFFLKLKSWFVKRLLKLKLITAAILLSFCYAKADTIPNQKTFNVIKNDKVIGTITINKQAFESQIVYHLKSDINAKVLINFCIKGEEKAVYKKGILVYSRVYRTVNNNIKSNHQIVFQNKKYLLKEASGETFLSLKPITANLVSLYFKEPKSLRFVYCDNARKMVTVEPLGEGKYKVVFESGKYNIYHYKDGKCVGVEANSKLFDVNLIPA